MVNVNIPEIESYGLTWDWNYDILCNISFLELTEWRKKSPTIWSNATVDSYMIALIQSFRLSNNVKVYPNKKNKVKKSLYSLRYVCLGKKKVSIKFPLPSSTLTLTTLLLIKYLPFWWTTPECRARRIIIKTVMGVIYSEWCFLLAYGG